MTDNTDFILSAFVHCLFCNVPAERLMLLQISCYPCIDAISSVSSLNLSRFNLVILYFPTSLVITLFYCTLKMKFWIFLLMGKQSMWYTYYGLNENGIKNKSIPLIWSLTLLYRSVKRLLVLIKGNVSRRRWVVCICH